MKYEEFKRDQELRIEKKRQEMNALAAREYNKGLLNGLGFFGANLYPMLKRNEA